MGLTFPNWNFVELIIGSESSDIDRPWANQGLKKKANETMQTNRTCIISVMWMTFLFSFWSYACIYSEWVKLKLSFCNLYNKCYPTEHGSVLKISMWDCLWFSYNISIDKREKIEGMWWKPCNCHNSERALWSLTMFLLVENESSYQFSNLNVHVILMWITFWMWTWLVD